MEAMRKEHALQALARLATADSADRVGSLSAAANIVRAALGSDDVRLFAGDAVTYEAYPQRDDEDFFGLSLDGLVSVTTELRRFGRAAVCTISEGGVPGEVAPADGSNAGTTWPSRCGEVTRSAGRSWFAVVGPGPPRGAGADSLSLPALRCPSSSTAWPTLTGRGVWSSR